MTTPQWWVNQVRRLGPGVALASAITLVAVGLGEFQELFVDHVVFEPLVLALLIGLAVRAVWVPANVFLPGIAFAAKPLLEFAIVVLGASLNLRAIVDAGGQLVVAVLISVTLSLCLGMGLGRLAGLGARQSALVAVGNAICGNSAIAAVAPAIRAKKEEVANAIALTAVLGIGVVLALPLIGRALDLTDERYGVVAGLTVYAVPQVLAATIPVSAEAGQVASLVKLTRVVLLGPVVALFAWMFRERGDGAGATATRMPLGKYLPWFVVGFLAMSLLRTSGVIPVGLGDAAKEVSRVLTSIAMAALGLGVDVRTVKSSGARVGGVVVLLTVLMVIAAITLVAAMGIG
jgi:uncharacterized integral membrane protein (TIGR00698 family)